MKKESSKGITLSGNIREVTNRGNAIVVGAAYHGTTLPKVLVHGDFDRTQDIGQKVHFIHSGRRAGSKRKGQYLLVAEHIPHNTPYKQGGNLHYTRPRIDISDQTKVPTDLELVGLLAENPSPHSAPELMGKVSREYTNGSWKEEHFPEMVIAQAMLYGLLEGKLDSPSMLAFCEKGGLFHPIYGDNTSWAKPEQAMEVTQLASQNLAQARQEFGQPLFEFKDWWDHTNIVYSPKAPKE